MPDRPSALHLLASDGRRGAETFGAVLCEQLTGRGWRNTVRAVQAEAGVHRHNVPALGRTWHDPRGLSAYVRLAREHDVVVAHGSITLWTAALGSLAGGPPFVYVNIGDPLFWTSTRARQWRVAVQLRRAARVAAISPRGAQALRGHLRVPADRVVVIPNARSSTTFAPADDAARASARQVLGLPVGAAVVAYIGALSAEKRAELAVRAVSGLAHAHLVVAGDGPQRTDLTRLADQIMPGRAHWLGTVERPAEVLAAADALLLTSRSEGVPGVLIEAGLSGLPAVTTDVGFAADVVLDGCTGRVVANADVEGMTAALREALAAGPRWGAAAREHCLSTYELEKVVSQWDALLRAVIAPE